MKHNRNSGLPKAQLKSGWCGWSLYLLFILFASQFLVSRKNPRAALAYNGHAPLPLRSSLHSATFANSLRYIPFLSKESAPQEITRAKIHIVLLYCIGLKGRHSFSSFVMVFLSSFQSQFLKQKFRLHSASPKKPRQRYSAVNKRDLLAGIGMLCHGFSQKPRQSWTPI